MSEKREYTLQLLQDQSGRTQSVHVTQGAKAVTPPEPEIPKKTGLLTVSPETIELKIYMDSDGSPGGGGASHSLEVTSAKISIKSQLLDSTGKMIRPLDVDFSVTPENSDVSVYNKVADSNGNITAMVSSEIRTKIGRQTNGVLHITQRETGIEKTIPVTATR